MGEILRDDIGQLLWIGYSGPVSDALRRRLERGEAGATILFKRNLPIAAGPPERCDLDALVELTGDLHRRAPDGTPALIAIDQEGGAVQRVRAPATRWPAMAALDRFAAPEDTALAEAVGRAIGDELAALGIDIDFAPVLDVHTNPANPIIGDRAFGTDAETVARRALAFARGLDAAGVVACGKHFPGHGDTATDSHLELPRIDHDWDRLERVELLPFHRAAAAGIPMIMTAHVLFAALDPARPATLSPEVITGLLRGRMAYRGVIVSDDLDMKAIADQLGAGPAAVAAIRAGCDVLLLCKDEDHQAEAEAALIREAEADSELRSRIGEAAARVRALKQAHAAARAARPAPARAVVGSATHQQLAARLATS
ncbi:MAG TPA: beta-N-acetylhexosaminidase [Kofleriaceae bacterium]|jgi:beta-N-acetylhexosaminidase|nr:beta-N-acetylhexosaminidase [Kofleriaceae bacterium]